jgi:gamma-glutamyltranspeptidase/glutathione hydrolase
VLGVVEPFSCGIGGGGFMVIRTRKGDVTTIDSRELSPEDMEPDSFMENGAPLAFNDARYSGLSAGVPGTVAGWADALSRHGTMSLREVLQPAIRIARDGFVVDQTFHDQTEANAAFFADVPSSAELFLDPDGTPKDVGSVFTNPQGTYAGYLVDQAGLKGRKVGGVQISELHGNFMVNSGDATAEDVRQMIQLIQDEVYRQFEIRLIPEIEQVGGK